MSDGSGQSTGQPPGNSHLPWHLIPPFKPGETDVNEYTRRLEFLANIWPQDQLALLAARACLLCEGTAFSKVVRLDATKLKVQSTEGIKLVVKTLGGVWGQSKLETKYERFEKAIFGTVQKPDETHKSYLARHEVQYEELINMGASLEEMRAYILIRNSGLSPEDKKKIIIDSGGNLEYDKVTSALQLLGSKFFAEVQSGAASRTNTRTKTYDVNYVDEDEHDHEETEEPIFFSQETTEDSALEILLAEGDPDAQVINQFEESLIDTLQSDPEIATCLNTYLEARRKISEKVKGRGFWVPKGSKGKGRGKNKGGFKQKFRKPLAQRILESTCRYCNQTGHWRAECPVRLKNANASAPTSGNAAFAGVAMASEIPHEVQSLSDDDDMPPGNATAYMTEETCYMISHRLYSPNMHMNANNGDKWDNRGDYNGVSQSSRLSLPSMLKSRLSQRFQAIVRSTTNEPIQCQHNPPGKECDRRVQSNSDDHSEELAHFASLGTHGIVDLGASMSVIGENQFKELCKSLPSAVLHAMKEAPCQVSFRFGNNSTVNGTRAIYFPVGSKWIKVVIVPTNTPFLIANSVFRNLRAVIDTAKGEVLFQEIGIRVPMKLSERKLFQIDLLDLLKNPCSHQGADVMFSEDTGQVLSPRSEENHVAACQKSPPCTDSHVVTPAENQLQSRLSKTPIGFPVSVSPAHHGPDTDRTGLWRSDRSPEATEHQGVRGSKPDSLHHGNDFEGAPRREDRVWKGSPWQALPRHDHRDQIHGVVHRELSTQSQASACEVPTLHSTMAGRPRESRAYGETHHAKGQSQVPAHDGECSDRTGLRRRSVGSTACREQCGDGRDAKPHGPDGECHPGSPRASEAHQSESDGLKEHLTPEHPVPPMLMADMCETWHNIFHTKPNDVEYRVGDNDVGENILYSRDTNWVALEMWRHFANKGIYPNSPMLQQCRADLLEVYCSQNSALTEQANQKGLWAERHGLNDGDLSTWEGRHRLYDRLLQLRLQNIWMSPRCKAWCRWNEFNRHKTQELANRIMTARQEDQVHLLLCDALFQFQTCRSRLCHAHLEQPVGSQMLYQEELAAVVDQSWIGRCDMCTAGHLKHPQTQNHLQKGTQILTTSEVMHRQVTNLRCTRDHVHDHVEGSCFVPQLGRVNVSQYTELYTRGFANKMVRSMQCSAQVSEANCQPTENALVTRSTDEVTDVPAKRRKLGIKQPPDATYQQVQHDLYVQKAIDTISKHAPSVGKRFFFDGPVLAEIQQLYPTVTIKCVELCKGADKLRSPPQEITKEVAPLRRTLGIHRRMPGNFEDNQWEEWGGLSKRQLNRHGTPARLLITVFGTQTDSMASVPASGNTCPGLSTRKHDDSPDSLEPDSKKLRFDASVPEMPAQKQQDQFPAESPCPESSAIKQKHGPNFLKLNPEERQQLLRMHNNLGHPDAVTLGNVLRDQQWPMEAVEGIKDMHCPACFERQRPRLARPSHLTEPREFNDMMSLQSMP